MCYGFIYDTIVNPYHIAHSLRNAVSLTHEEIDKISQTFLEVISDFRDLYFFEDIGELSPDQCDEWTWVKFKEENPDGYSKIQEEVEKTIKSMKLKKKHMTEELVTRFFMNKLKILMVNLPQIHLDHSLKFFIKELSPGPIPYEKLVEIRKKAGLSIPPIPEYKENFDDLYS
jgi:hypothetical protein